MRSIDVFCSFPRAVEAMAGVGVVGKAIERGEAELRTFDLHDFSLDGRIDDMPFGGGPGMVIRVDLVARALEEVYGMPADEVRRHRRVLLTEPYGRVLDQGYVDEIATGSDLTLLCGRYGGMDERVRHELASGTVCLGPFVLSGGEIVACAVIESTVRLLEGVVGNRESLEGESFSEEERMGPPQYTRPALWNGVGVPPVLLSGDHGKIRAWREEQARLRARSFAAGDVE